MRSYDFLTLDCFTFVDEEDVTFNEPKYYEDGHNTCVLTKTFEKELTCSNDITSGRVALVSQAQLVTAGLISSVTENLLDKYSDVIITFNRVSAVEDKTHELVHAQLKKSGYGNFLLLTLVRYESDVTITLLQQHILLLGLAI